MVNTQCAASRPASVYDGLPRPEVRRERRPNGDATGHRTAYLLTRSHSAGRHMTGTFRPGVNLAGTYKQSSGWPRRRHRPRPSGAGGEPRGRQSCLPPSSPLPTAEPFLPTPQPRPPLHVATHPGSGRPLDLWPQQAPRSGNNDRAPAFSTTRCWPGCARDQSSKSLHTERPPHPIRLGGGGDPSDDYGRTTSSHQPLLENPYVQRGDHPPPPRTAGQSGCLPADPDESLASRREDHTAARRRESQRDGQ